MSLQYKLEQVPEVERAFVRPQPLPKTRTTRAPPLTLARFARPAHSQVHIDYKARPYDEHVNSRQFESYQQQQSFDQEVERTGSPVSATSGSSYDMLDNV